MRKERSVINEKNQQISKENERIFENYYKKLYDALDNHLKHLKDFNLENETEEFFSDLSYSKPNFVVLPIEFYE